MPVPPGDDHPRSAGTPPPPAGRIALPATTPVGARLRIPAKPDVSPPVEFSQTRWGSLSRAPRRGTRLRVTGTNRGRPRGAVDPEAGRRLSGRIATKGASAPSAARAGQRRDPPGSDDHGTAGPPPLSASLPTTKGLFQQPARRWSSRRRRASATAASPSPVADRRSWRRGTAGRGRGGGSRRKAAAPPARRGNGGSSPGSRRR